jgi:hypothetical protein
VLRFKAFGVYYAYTWPVPNLDALEVTETWPLFQSQHHYAGKTLAFGTFFSCPLCAWHEVTAEDERCDLYGNISSASKTSIDGSMAQNESQPCVAVMHSNIFADHRSLQEETYASDSVSTKA